MIARIALVIFLMFLVFIVYSADRGRLPEAVSFYKQIPLGDALGHFCLMGLLAFLAVLGSKARFFRLAGKRIPLGSIVVLAIVCLEEFSQLFIPGRTFSLIDLAADFLGILAFSWLALRIHDLRTRCKSNPASPGTSPAL